jgi:hypothetical protein
MTDAPRAREVGRRPFRGRGGAERAWPLWAAYAGAPAAWALAVGASYAVVPLACEWGTALPLHAIRAVTLAVAAAATAAVFALWRDVRGGRALRLRRTETLAFVGIAVAGFSALLIALEGVANFVVDPCR